MPSCMTFAVFKLLIDDQEQNWEWNCKYELLKDMVYKSLKDTVGFIKCSLQD